MPTEADTCRKFVVPKLQTAGWDNEPHSIAEQRTITDGRIVPVGKGFIRKPPKRVDYLLRYTRDFPLAVVEAKASYKTAADAIQQARTYAEMLGLKFAFATNGHDIIEIDYFTGVERACADYPTKPAARVLSAGNSSILNRLKHFEVRRGPPLRPAILIALLQCRPSRNTQQGDAPMKRRLITVAVGLLLSTPALADEDCNIPDSTVKNLQAKLATVVNLPDANGGLFKPNRMWSAVVDRQGVLCSVVRSDPDAWPGSRSIAIAKASTANDFSNNKTALSPSGR
jgi:hypothetical protein